MNIPEQAIEAAAKALAELEPGEDWPSNTDLGGHALLGTRDDEFKWAMEQDAERALTAALPHIEAALRTQIAAEQGASLLTTFSASSEGKPEMTLYEQIKEDHQFCTTTDETGRRAFCSCGDAHYHWSAREESHEVHFAEMFEQALRTQIANDIRAEAERMPDRVTQEEVDGMNRAARIAEEGAFHCCAHPKCPGGSICCCPDAEEGTTK